MTSDAAPDAAVEQDLDLVADRGDDVGQSADRRHAAVEVVAAVVRDDDRVDALGHGAACVVGAKDPLHDQRPLPELPQPRDVLPPRRLLVHRLDAAVEAVHRLAFLVQGHRDRRLWPAVAEKVGQPAGPHQGLRREADRLREAHPLRHARTLRDRPQPRATRGRSRVDGEDEPLHSCALDPLDDRFGLLAAAEVVELVEDRACRDGHDLLDRRRGGAAHEHQGLRRARRARDSALPVAVADRELPARRERDRHRDLVAADRGAEIALGIPAADVRPKQHLLERGEVRPRRHVRAAAAVVVLKDALRQPAPRELARVVDRQDL